jgi:hypothetical protein
MESAAGSGTPVELIWGMELSFRRDAFAERGVRG